MKYHKKLTREDAAKQGWKKILLMIASEFSRANHLSKTGDGSEVKACVLRARELFGVLESEKNIPSNIANSLLVILKEIAKPSNIKYGKLYNNFTALAS